MIQRKYVWNERNLMQESSENRQSVYYRYGADGQRALKSSNQSETLYFNTMWSWLHNSSAYNTERESKHIYLGSERLVTRTNGAGTQGNTYTAQVSTYYYHSDHLGSAQLITDSEGKEYERVEYTPYGEYWIEKRATENRTLPFKFTGKERDEETGLYYYGARYLDAKTSRWLTTDPALGEYIPMAPTNDNARKHNQNLPGMGGIYNSINMHLYHYAGIGQRSDSELQANNPVKYIDPDGRVIFGINAIHNMSNYTNFLGNSTTETINSHGCYITAFANVFASSKYYGLPLINAEKYDSPLKINSDKALFGKDLGELKGKDAMNALFGTGKWDYWTKDKQGADGLLEKLKEYKQSNKAYMILGIFDLSEDTPSVNNHMVGISELPDSEGYFNSGITGSSNGDYLRLINIREKSAYNIKNLKEIRVIFLED